MGAKGGLATVGVVICVLVGIVTLEQAISLETDGVRTTGRVVSLELVSHDDQAGEYASLDPVVEFVTDGGRTYTTPPLTHGFTSPPEVGMEVPIVYRRGSPASATVDTVIGRWMMPLITLGTVAWIGRWCLSYARASEPEEEDAEVTDVPADGESAPARDESRV